MVRKDYSYGRGLDPTNNCGLNYVVASGYSGVKPQVTWGRRLRDIESQLIFRTGSSPQRAHTSGERDPLKRDT